VTVRPVLSNLNMITSLKIRGSAASAGLPKELQEACQF
jgi:hypothetical protein